MNLAAMIHITMCDDGTLWSVDSEHDLRFMKRSSYMDANFVGEAWT